MSSNIKRCSSKTVTQQNISQAQHPKTDWKSKLTRNFAIATCALLTVVGIRQSAAGNSFLQAVQGAIESEWDQSVGRLTYVGNMLSDSIQVFGSYNNDPNDWTSPVCAQAVQSWSQESPYLLYHNAGNVYAVAPGEVTSVAHDDNSYYIIRLMHENGFESLYFGLKSCFVQEGTTVTADTLLGQSAPEFAFEAQKNGRSWDCSAQLGTRE